MGSGLTVSSALQSSPQATHPLPVYPVPHASCLPLALPKPLHWLNGLTSIVSLGNSLCGPSILFADADVAYGVFETRPHKQHEPAQGHVWISIDLCVFVCVNPAEAVF